MSLICAPPSLLPLQLFPTPMGPRNPPVHLLPSYVTLLKTLESRRTLSVPSIGSPYLVLLPSGQSFVPRHRSRAPSRVQVVSPPSWCCVCPPGHSWRRLCCVSPVVAAPLRRLGSVTALAPGRSSRGWVVQYSSVSSVVVLSLGPVAPTPHSTLPTITASHNHQGYSRCNRKVTRTQHNQRLPITTPEILAELPHKLPEAINPSTDNLPQTAQTTTTRLNKLKIPPH